MSFVSGGFTPAYISHWVAVTSGGVGAQILAGRMSRRYIRFAVTTSVNVSIFPDALPSDPIATGFPYTVDGPGGVLELEYKNVGPLVTASWVVANVTGLAGVMNIIECFWMPS